MKKLLVRFLSLAVSALMVLSLLPALVPAALADGGTPNPTGDGYYWSTDGSGVTITAYTGTGTNLTVPAKIDGADVVKIGDGAFANSAVRSVAIPQGVTEIGQYAFSSCHKLVSVSIPASVSAIGDDMFDDCPCLAAIQLDPDNSSFCLDGYGVLYDAAKTKLIASPAVNSRTSFTVPDTVTSIGTSAFNNNTALETVTVPDTVTSIGWTAFSGCTSLKSFAIPDGIDSVGGLLFWKCSSLKSVTIPSSVKSIGQSAFYGCKSLTGVTLPSGLTTIDLYAFGSSGLTSVDIPAGTTTIDDMAFSNCNSLTEFNVEAGNTTFKAVDGVLYKLKDSNGGAIDALLQYPAAKTGSTFAIPDGVTYLYIGCFNYCNNLTKITIPESVGFTDPNCPDNTDPSNFEAFHNCSKLSDFETPGANNKFSVDDHILYSKDKSYLYYYPSTKTDTTFELPKQVNDIRCQFNDCKTIASFTVEAGSASYFTRDGILYDKKGLVVNDLTSYIVMYSYPQAKTADTLTMQTKIEYPAGSGKFYNLGHEVGAISGNPFIKHVIYVDGTDRIGSFQFYNCVNLERVDIPESVTAIGQCIFSGCAKLKSVTIPARVTSIEPNAFENCSGLETVIFEGGSRGAPGSRSGASSSLTSIGDGTFVGCSSLKSINIPDSVTDIGSSVFSGCDSLTAINVGAGNNTYSSLSGVLYNKARTRLLQYPLNRAGTAFVVPASVRMIADGAFAGCRNLKKVGISASVTDIDTFAFSAGAKSRLTIYGAAGSCAEAYAHSLGIPFSTQKLTCKVTFNSRSGSAVPCQTVVYGAKAAAPANPVRAGYTFSGWYSDSACTKAWSFSVNTVTGDITLFAKWALSQSNVPSANLSGIVLSAGKLQPSFKPAVTEYTVILKETDAGVKITPKMAYSGAAISIDRARIAYKYVAVANGKTAVVTVKVTCGHTTRTYSITVKRPKSSDNRLSALKVSAGALSPAFNPGVTSYTLTLPKGTGKVTVTATKASPLATITNGRKTYNLTNGQTVYDKITVRSQSGATKVYTVKITRAK